VTASTLDISTSRPRHAVLADRLPATNARAVRFAGQVAGVAAFTALLAQVSFRIPGTPVPVTGQTFAVLLAAAAVGPLRGVVGQLLYLVLGVGGLPVFSDGAHGWSYFVGSTFGFLIGFVLASAVVGRHARRGLDRKPDTVAATFLLGSALIYLPGVWWLSHHLGVSYSKAMELGVYPFLVGDVVKAALAACLLPAAWRLLGTRRSR
jgi:biotin transport system substrate-specific component